MVKGPYQYARNPMYVFVVLALIGEAIFFETMILVVFAALTVIFFHLRVVLYEEPTLKGEFGEAYERYYSRVSRWLPRLADRSRARLS